MELKSLTLLGPEPAFGRLGLGGSSGGYSSHGYTSHALLRAFGAQLEGDRFRFLLAIPNLHLLHFIVIPSLLLFLLEIGLISCQELAVIESPPLVASFRLEKKVGLVLHPSELR